MKNIKKGKINKYWSHDFAHLIKGYCPLWQTRGVLIPSPCVKTTLEPVTLKVRRHSFLVFLTFSSNKRWGRLHAFSFLGRRTHEPSHSPLAEGKVAKIAFWFVRVGYQRLLIGNIDLKHGIKSNQSFSFTKRFAHVKRFQRLTYLVWKHWNS